MQHKLHMPPILYLFQLLITYVLPLFFFFFSSRRRHTRFDCDWSSDVCSSDLQPRQRMVDGVELTLDLGHVVGARCALQALLQQGQDFTVGAAALAGILVEDDVEIGRASCRERV